MTSSPLTFVYLSHGTGVPLPPLEYTPLCVPSEAGTPPDGVTHR